MQALTINRIKLLWLMGIFAGLLGLSMGVYFYGNQPIFLVVNSMDGQEWSGYLWLNITLLGDKAIFLCLALIIGRLYPQASLSIFISFMITSCLVIVLKDAVHILRPAVYFPAASVNILGEISSSYAWPSGHTASAWVLFTGIYLSSQRHIVTILALSLACLVGVSRIMVGMHWPADVLAGAMLGLVVTNVVWLGVNKLDAKLVVYLELLFACCALAAVLSLIAFAEFFVASQAVILARIIALLALVSGFRYIVNLVNKIKNQHPSCE